MEYYDKLGVSKTATISEIKQAYRKLAREYHPDINKSPEAEDKFKEINAAYEIVGDPVKRKQYDANLNNMFSSFGTSNFSNKFNINDIFNNFGFGGGNDKKPTPKKTFFNDLETEIIITFEESIFGSTEKKIINTYKSECPDCLGYGGAFQECLDCKGTGLKNKSEGFISINVSCSTCMGKGKNIIGVCDKCNSQGYMDKTEELTIKVPEGIEARTQLFVKGKGNYINGKRGDLYLRPNVEQSNTYERLKNDLYTTMYIDIFDIILEKTINIETIKGNFPLKLSKDVLERKIVKSGLGTKSINSDTYGNMYIEIKAKIPNLSKENKNDLQDFIEKTLNNNDI